MVQVKRETQQFFAESKKIFIEPQEQTVFIQNNFSYEK